MDCVLLSKPAMSFIAARSLTASSVSYRNASNTAFKPEHSLDNGLCMLNSGVLRGVECVIARCKGAGAVQSEKRSSESQKQGEKSDLMSTIFDTEVRDRLFYTMSYSNTMREYVGAVFRAIKQGGG